MVPQVAVLHRGLVQFLLTLEGVVSSQSEASVRKIFSYTFTMATTATPNPTTNSFLVDDCPPMGIYETLYKFADSFGAHMGGEGTHPWSQGFPLTTPLTEYGGPELPSSVEVTWKDRFYPKAWGHPLLRARIVEYYNTNYGTSIVADNVMIFAGGRPGIYTILAFLKQHVQVSIGNVEWPAYLDILTQTNTDFKVVPFTKENGFHPPNSAYYDRTGLNAKTHIMPVISNPSNPTGHTRSGEELKELMEMAEQSKNGILLDEAYEWFHTGSVSGLQYVSRLFAGFCLCCMFVPVCCLLSAVHCFECEDH